MGDIFAPLWFWVQNELMNDYENATVHNKQTKLPEHGSGKIQ